MPPFFFAGIGDKDGFRLLLNLSSHLISPPEALPPSPEP